jgi:hypothetical protein
VRDHFETLTEQLVARREQRPPGRKFSRSYTCRCGAAVSFLETACASCGSPLGYLPDEFSLVALDSGPEPEAARAAGFDRIYAYCANRSTPAVCNWMKELVDPSTLCVACRLNRTIPDLDDANNARYWAAIEAAKHRLVAQLLALGLPVKSRVEEDTERGLMFDFLRSRLGNPPVMTGHANGLITLNIEEADDVKREQIKHDLHEPYRTLLGHLRHEVGHYYWDLLVRDSEWLQPFRQEFGDERADYTESLKAYYKNGPPIDWSSSYISSYAAAHPWEDWAETWAHYLHLVDSLGTAIGFGLDASNLERKLDPFTSQDLFAPDHPQARPFLALLNAWSEMILVLNELAHSMGQPDIYPFTLSQRVVAKLQFVHIVVTDSQNHRAPDSATQKERR